VLLRKWRTGRVSDRAQFGRSLDLSPAAQR